MKTVRYFAGIAKTMCRIYVFGGEYNDMIKKHAEYFDTLDY